MAKYRMEDGTLIDTEKAKRSWTEAEDWDGRNMISRATGTQWTHQELFESRKGRFYLEHWSQWQGSRAHIEWVSPEEAARWLLHNDHELPEALAKLEAEVVE